MRFTVRVVTDSPLSFREILRAPPAWLRVADLGQDEFVVSRSAEAVTGVRLSRDARGPRMDLPLFAASADISLAKDLMPEIARALGGALDTGGMRIAAGDFGPVFERDLAPLLVHRSMDEMGAILASSDDRVFVVEGHRRAYHLGIHAAQRAMGLAGGAIGEGFLRLLGIIASIQELGPETAEPRARAIRTPDGREAMYAVWDPRRETLIPPCDFVLVTADAPSSYVRVAAADVSHVVTSASGSVHGVRIDDRQWLMGALGESEAAAVVARAREVGKGLKIPSSLL